MATGGPVLSWSGSDPDGDPLQFQVLFGTTNPPTTIQCPRASPTTCAAPVITAGATYYWRVDSWDGEVTTPGHVWSFKANRPPNAPANPTPQHAESYPDRNPNKSVTLSWTGSDPDGQALEYRVLFDQAQSPPTTPLCDWSSLTTCTTPASLQDEANFFWKVEARDLPTQEVTAASAWHFRTGLQVPTPTPQPTPQPGDVCPPVCEQ